MARDLELKLTVIFRHLVKVGSFPECWRLADVVLVSKESSFYRPLSITLLLSKVAEKIVAGKVSYFLKSKSLLPPSQFSHRRGLGTCDALLTLPHHLQIALHRSMEGRLVQ